ncbi:MAG TPA: PSD1 and planctomycete cytochrome C domain-containing protein [Gemmataceae bacterium]|nr:PSD1 and planctomycete cytochrome C domain-containing protein [Gemmataceae bacterium]
MIARVYHIPRLLAAVCLISITFFCLKQSSAIQAAKPERQTQPTIDFNRQILPLLSDNCFACHGPDEKQRKAKLRLDTKEGAFKELRGGGFAIVPGKAGESKLIERVTAEEPAERMPPVKSGKHLTTEQIALLRQWIDQGAVWSEHWAFVAPRRPPIPKVADKAWPRNAIDYFILARLEAAGLQPSSEADKAKLLRRVTLDLTGLPPTPAEIDAFLADTSPEAYERVVNRLLESSRYGEHMTRYWLDAARYGDTHGLHLDNYREMWPYREWVIKAFNNNLPYDRFIIEQLAGDMLPNATLDQIVASGFNRCHVTTSEGGSIDEEVYVRNVDDRVDTTGIVFMGLTTGCARCHDHKYDPIKTKDYYQLFAIFNSLDDKPLDGNAARYPPIVKVATAEQRTQLERLEQKVTALKGTIAAELAKVKIDDGTETKAVHEIRRAEYVWIDDGIPAGAREVSDGGINGPWRFTEKPAHPVFSGSRSVVRTSQGLGQLVFQDARPGLIVGTDDTLFAYAYLDPARPPREIMLQWNTGDWKHRAYWGDNLISWGADSSTERRHMGPLPSPGKWVRLEVPASKVGLKPGMEINGWAFTQHDGTVYWDRAGIVTRTPQGEQKFDTLAKWLKAQQESKGAGLPKPLQAVIKLEPAKRSESQKQQLRDYFIEAVHTKTRATFEPLRRQLAQAEKDRDQLDKLIPTSLVSRELPTARPAYILTRGEYDRHGAPVSRDTPGFLPPLPQGLPRNRLGFAQWLVRPEHPLTARVAINHFWQQLFGTGLVKTSEDLGMQSEPPSHPELLDWLAVQFREDGWDVKKFMKRLVMSATYRQSPRITADRLAKDPANRLLSRGPRFRLDAETIRDQALFVSGLLVEKTGGPSVKPPQPGGLWEAVGYVTSNTAKFVPDSGAEKIHRRSLYTFWKRTASPPQMNAFDAPSREACTVRRERTNTPLQALLLLNETQYVECARALAERTMHECKGTAEARINYMFRLATSRSPDARELAELVTEYKDHLATYGRDLKEARSLIAIGESKPDASLKASELAAWTMIANLLLNLDEVVNKG